MARLTKRERANLQFQEIENLPADWMKFGIFGFIYGLMTGRFTNLELDRIEEQLNYYKEV